MRQRRSALLERLFIFISWAAIALALAVLFTLVADLLYDGLPRLSWKFLANFPSRRANEAGVLSALVGSICLVALTVVFALPIGIGAALYLEEYAPDTRLTRLIELNIANLAGIPSILFGILGLQVFVRWMHLGRSLLAGALTMTLLILPVIIIVSREAIRQVPQSIRHGSYALGANRWQTIRYQVLPIAMPAIMTGCILAFSRALGESAPLIAVGALTYVAFLPEHPLSMFTALPIQAFNWLSRPQEAFHANAAGAILVLLAMLLTLNSVAIWIRYRRQVRSA